MHGSITTTIAKAKSIQAYTEKMVTKSKVNNLITKRFLTSELNDNLVTEKLLTEIGPLFKTTDGGYTKIIKLVNRIGDNSKMCIISFTKAVSKSEQVEKKLEQKTKSQKAQNKKESTETSKK